jgi:DNA-binding transcriptional LysR family regulator
MLEFLVPTIRERYPDISLIVVPRYEIDDLQDPAFDFAVRVGRIRDDALVANKIGAFSRILVCAPSHPRARSSSAEMLKDRDLLAFSGRSPRFESRLHQKEHAEQEITLDREAQFSIADFDALVRLSRAGYGVVEVPDFMVHGAIANFW